MTDDLVKRLRAGTGGGKHWMDLHTEAADRIEGLEAKLAQAVEALAINPWSIGYVEWKKHVNDTLAELK